MNVKAAFCAASCILVVIGSVLLPGSVLAQSSTSFSSVILPIIPGIAGPEPLPPPPAEEEPPMPGNTFLATSGISEAGSTQETGRTLQVSARTGSESSRGVALPLSPYVLPPTDTDLALASPFGGPGYVAAGQPRPGDARFGRTLSRRTLYDLTTLSPSPVSPMESALAAGPLDMGPKPPATAPSTAAPAGVETTGSTPGK